MGGRNDFWWGVAAGVAGTYAFHRWVKPIGKGKKNGG